MADMSIQEKALKSQRSAGRFIFIYNILFTVAAVIVGVIALTISA
ncbi:MAG: hypothetical protein AAGU74_14480 [Bacillota bacterium]